MIDRYINNYGDLEKNYDGNWVKYSDYEKLDQQNKILNQIQKISDSGYKQLMADYQALIIKYNKLLKGN